MQACRARTTVVVHVVDRDPRHAELVKDALSTRAVAVAVACDPLVDVVVVHPRVQHGFHAGFEAHLGIVDLAAGLDELGHADAENVDRMRRLLRWWLHLDAIDVGRRNVVNSK